MNKQFLDAQVKSLKEGEFEVVASSGKVDRLGDTINPNGWYLTNYRKNPVILWSHSGSGFMDTPIPPVARADKVWVEEEKELKIKGHFADTPFAQELRTLVEGGFLNAVSVGFIPLAEDKKGNIEIEGKMYRQVSELELKSYIEIGSIEIDEKLYSREGNHFEKQELLEVSWVNIPALPTALVSAKKMGMSLITKALEDLKNQEDKDINKESDKLDKILALQEEAISLLKGELKENPEETTLNEGKGRASFIKKKSKSDIEKLLIIFDKMCETLLKKVRQ